MQEPSHAGDKTDCRFKALLHCFHFSDPEATSIIYKLQQTCIEFHFKQDLVTVHFVSKNFFSLRRHRSIPVFLSPVLCTTFKKWSLHRSRFIVFINIVCKCYDSYGVLWSLSIKSSETNFVLKVNIVYSKKMFTCGFARIQGYAFVLRGRLACVLQLVCCTLNLLPPIWCEGWKDCWRDQK